MPVERETQYSRTGLATIRARGQVLYRIAKPAYGPLNPPRRALSGDRRAWNRFDLPGAQTVYAASTPEGAYGEMLGSLKRPTRTVDADALFDDARGAPIETLIAQDWADAGIRLPPYVVDIDYLYASHLYTVALPRTGHLVVAEHSRTVTYLHERLRARVTVSDIRSEDRSLTTHLAELLASARVAQDETPFGLRFGSKHGSNWDCWAIWLRGDVVDQLVADDGRPITHPRHNPPLAAVLDSFNLSVQ